MRIEQGIWGILPLLLAACSNEYVCPDPIGRIIRDDCEVYKTKYESLKVEAERA